MSRLLVALALLVLASTSRPAQGADRPPFFAMDTIARGTPDAVVAMLSELGYDGLGGTAGDGAMARALQAKGLTLFNGYLTLEFRAEASALDSTLQGKIDAMAGQRSALWLAISRVSDAGKAFPKSSPEADDLVLRRLREILAYAEPRGVRIALYPHTNSWLERVDDAIRVADKLDHPSVGVTFNLCHWLRVEGSERDPVPVLESALPRLLFVTINGADTGDTTHMGWDRLIQPLDRGTYDVAGFLAQLRTLGYRGPIGFQGYGIKEDPRQVLQRTIEAWRRFTP